MTSRDYYQRGFNLIFNMKKFLLLLALFVNFSWGFAYSEPTIKDLATIKEGDIMEVRLNEVHPTQPVVAFDEIYYKMGRFSKDRRKIFREYCKHNGQLEVLNMTDASNLRDPSSFSCLQPVGMSRSAVKTVVIAPNGQLYLTNGHHSFIELWMSPEGGPNSRMHVQVERDYRYMSSMDDFWNRMIDDQNIWLFDENNKPIAVTDLPENFDIKNFRNDPYRSLMYFTRKIAWNSPEKFVVPDSDDYYPAIPFVEFYWAREVRKTVKLCDYDLNTLSGYIAAIRAVGKAIRSVQSSNVGGSGKTLVEVGQFQYFNERELTRISRPGTGKLAYILEYKAARRPELYAGQNHLQVNNGINPRIHVAD